MHGFGAVFAPDGESIIPRPAEVFLATYPIIVHIHIRRGF
jgi:hypothetical protein